MGKSWDNGDIAFSVDFWREVRRVLKPGGYLLAFGGTRTWHRQACAIEDAGFHIRDTLMWLFGQGFPKAKSCLKPAWEPITLAWNPAAKVTPLQIDACRIPAQDGVPKFTKRGEPALNALGDGLNGSNRTGEMDTTLGRYPANAVHDGSPEVLEAFAAFGETRPGHFPKSCESQPGYGWTRGNGRHPSTQANIPPNNGFADSGSAARFFYCAKATKADRGEGNTHPTVKPTRLLEWLCRLVCPPGGTVLDPFVGSGTTGIACFAEGFDFVGIEKVAEYHAIAERRIASARAAAPLFA